MKNYNEQDLQNTIQLSNTLFSQNRAKFGTIHKIDNIELLGAIEYLSYVIYPYNLKERIKFYNSLIWLIIKTDESINSKEKKQYIKMMCGAGHDKLNFKNTEQNYVKASNILEKRIQTVHAFELTLNRSNSFRSNLLNIYWSYKVKNGKPTNTKSDYFDRDDQLGNAKKEIYRPSRGVIHLAYGFIETFFNSCPIEDRSIRAALHDPLWVNEAIKVSEEHLKMRLLSSYYQEKGIKTGTNLKFELNEIILLIR